MRDRLVLAVTPIGSHTHANPTLREALSAIDVIAVGDTRRLAALPRRIDVATAAQMLPYFEGSEAARTAELTEAIIDGQDIMLVADASMSSVSGPGYHLVAACVERGLPVTAVSRLSVVPTALVVSGLLYDRFCLEGFLPRKAGERRVRLAGLTAEERTMTFFEAPRRLHEWLLDAADTFDADRRAVVCRELTKPHEEIVKDSLVGLIGWVAGGVRGEVIAAVARAEPARAGTSNAPELMASRITDGGRLSQTVRVVADLLEVPHKKLYKAALTARKKEQ